MYSHQDFKISILSFWGFTSMFCDEGLERIETNSSENLHNMISTSTKLLVLCH